MKRCPNGHVTQNDSLNFCTECGKMLEPYLPSDNGGGSTVGGQTTPKQSIGGTLKRIVVGAIVLLVVAVGFIYRQMQRLSAARNKLEHANEQLQLSNNIKEEYVGRFMNLCSVYINRLDTYRRMVNKKISAGQMEELLKMVRSREVLDTGLKELYDNFDTAFLHLFPDFVDKFNDLLQPEERIVLRKGELLNTELRIFALIRLGIDDSSQIAEFLRYSVNTIYNYRAKVKNKARISREDFEIRLMQIR